MLEATVALLSQDAAHAGMQVTISGQSPPVMADAELLKIVFINLFVNSSQAMKGHGDVEVTVAAGTASVHCRHRHRARHSPGRA